MGRRHKLQRLRVSVGTRSEAAAIGEADERSSKWMIYEVDRGAAK